MKIMNWIRDWQDRRRRDRERVAWCRTVYTPEIKEALSKQFKSGMDLYAERIEPRTLSNLCDRMAEQMMADNSWPKEWAPVEYRGDEQIGSYDLARCLEKYMQRFAGNIVAELGESSC